MTSGKPRSITWNGVEYPSLAAAARELGITRERMRQRINAGMTCDEDLWPPEQRSEWLKKPFTWNGVQYPSRNAAAHSLGISRATIQARVRRGQPRKEDVE